MRFSRLTLVLIALALGAASVARAEEAAGVPVYTVTYFEVSASEAAQAAALAWQFVTDSRKEPGNAGFEAFAEIGRPNRLATLEAWRDTASAAAHAAAAPANGFRDRLQPMLASPFEIRSFDGLSVAAPAGRGGREAVWVLTHVDVFPAGKDRAADLAKALAEAGRKTDGNLSFDVLRQTGHPNHFTLVEGWRDRKAFEASVMSAATKDFRRQLTPLEGALYDERLYRALRS